MGIPHAGLNQPLVFGEAEGDIDGEASGDVETFPPEGAAETPAPADGLAEAVTFGEAEVLTDPVPERVQPANVAASTRTEIKTNNFFFIRYSS